MPFAGPAIALTLASQVGTGHYRALKEMRSSGDETPRLAEAELFPAEASP